MLDAANYATTETLRDGSTIFIRALKPSDREELVAAAARLSPQSLYRRFFGPKRHFSAAEISYFLDIDFSRHVALVALARERGRDTIIASGRYIMTTDKEAEVAFLVADSHQGRGIGSLLLRHLTAIARDHGVGTFVADVLPENTGMLKVFANSGVPVRKTRKSDAVHLTMDLASPSPHSEAEG
jgi:RimJ/RimL family protein N-acetyltransferase